MKAAITICSRQKDPDAELLPARERYLGGHIKKTDLIAEEQNLPFYILSGKHGLISADDFIPDYDYLLSPDGVDALAKLVKGQAEEAGITEADFYIEEKDSWVPYVETMKKAARLASMPLRIKEIG